MTYHSDLINRPAALQNGQRGRQGAFDLYKVDYKWIEEQSSLKELKKAIRALEQDQGFPDLLAAVKNKLKELDTSFKTTEDFNNYTPAEERAAQDEVMAFLDEMNETDLKIRGEGTGARSKKAIFEDEKMAVQR